MTHVLYQISPYPSLEIEHDLDEGHWLEENFVFVKKINSTTIDDPQMVLKYQLDLQVP